MYVCHVMCVKKGYNETKKQQLVCVFRFEGDGFEWNVISEHPSVVCVSLFPFFGGDFVCVFECLSLIAVDGGWKSVAEEVGVVGWEDEFAASCFVEFSGVEVFPKVG